MKVLFMIIDVSIIIAGGVLGYMGYKLRAYKPKYQCEKTTSGRTVQFLEHLEMKRYLRNKTLGILMLLAGIMFLIIGILAVISAYLG